MDLYEQKELVAEKLKSCLRDKGYTKSSFVQKSGIKRSILDQLLLAGVNIKNISDNPPKSETTFTRQQYNSELNRVLLTLNITERELMDYDYYHENVSPVTKYKMNSKAQKQYELLLDIVDLCGIYY